ncbi:MAG: hypothetical protein JXR64_08460 [Spirochaetales bacterium]|nr:hypothetical protein [Spirochaetales bacterium]
MKKKITYIEIFLLTLSICGYFIISFIEYDRVSTTTIDFELPLPKEISKLYSVSQFPVVDYVVLAGFFSDWDGENKNYIMKPDVDDPLNYRWSIDIFLPPGEHQYKFAIHLKNSGNVIWCQDSDLDKLVPNGMDSLNSVIKIGNFDLIKNILLMVGALSFILFLYSLDTKKNLYILVIFFIFFNILFLIIRGNYAQKENGFISRSIVSILQNKIDSNLNYYQSFNTFLWYDLNKIGLGNLDTKYRDISLFYFNNNFELVASDSRKFSGKDIKLSSKLEQFINQFTILKEKNINISNYRMPQFDDAYLNKNSFIYPNIVNNEIVGFYGILYSYTFLDLIFLSFKFNIILSILYLSILWLFSFIRVENKNNDDQFIKEFSGKYGITPREEDILTYIIEGFSNKEIAEIKNISKRTVDNHIYNTLHKVDAKNRVELVNIIKNGL